MAFFIHKGWTICVITSGCVVLLIGIIFMPVFDAVLRLELQKLLPLTSASQTLGTWEDPRDSVNMFIKFYLFHLENPSQVIANRSKPLFKQLGPFTYNEYKVKVNVTFHDNGTVSYREIRSMVFNQPLSVGGENDTLITLNAPLYSVISMLKGNNVELDALNLFSKFIKDNQMFVNLTVYQLLWGYKDSLLADAAALIDILKIKNLPIPAGGYFGLFYQKNNSDDGRYSVNTGVNNLTQFMEVTDWNYMSLLPYWKTDFCNMLNGTDGTMYHPYIEQTDILSLFSSDLCRSITVNYDSTLQLEDVDLYHFVPPASLFEYPPENEASACYCLSDTCPHAGVLNISQCQLGAPVFVSQPHFLNGEYYLSLVDGLSPDNSLHNTFIDVEPTTGIVMQGAKRLQLNLAIEPEPRIDQAKQLPSLIFPMMWLEEAAAINDYGMQQFKAEFFNLRQTIRFTSYILIFIGAITILLMGIHIADRWTQWRKLKKSPTALTERSPLVNSENVQ